MKTRKKRNKYLVLFITLFIIGMIISLIYFNSLKKEEINVFINSIKTNDFLSKPINNITNHLKILSVITIFSVIFIGFPICSGLIISEGFDFFFRLIILYKTYKIKGSIYALLYYLINNLIYIMLLYIIFKKIIIICRKIYKYKVKNDNSNISDIYLIIYKIIYLIIFIFISDVIIYLYSSKILNMFAFLLK